MPTDPSILLRASPVSDPPASDFKLNGYQDFPTVAESTYRMHIYILQRKAETLQEVA